jgi:hypothetical protein
MDDFQNAHWNSGDIWKSSMARKGVRLSSRRSQMECGAKGAKDRESAE